MKNQLTLFGDAMRPEEWVEQSSGMIGIAPYDFVEFVALGKITCLIGTRGDGRFALANAVQLYIEKKLNAEKIDYGHHYRGVIKTDRLLWETEKSVIIQINVPMPNLNEMQDFSQWAKTYNSAALLVAEATSQIWEKPFPDNLDIWTVMGETLVRTCHNGIVMKRAHLPLIELPLPDKAQ